MRCPPYFILFVVCLLSENLWANTFVGSEACADCHQVEFKDWRGSHHEKAMQHANANTVLADFNDQTVLFKGQASRFFRKGDGFWVNIADAAGKFNDYQIKYTFGYEPLQQYMVEFDDGRVQLIPFAWDTRSVSDGGQRWFYLHPDQSESHQDFFWTNTGQNWNFMCADCHSTNVEKNFDAEANSYNTTFSEINVGCEACHGPASKHIEWSKKGLSGKASDTIGFDRKMQKRVESWLKPLGATTLQPENITDSDQVLVCAQCHSRHVQISNADHVASGRFGDRYMLNFIDQARYHPDGQVYDEDYVYGSFLQSKMNAKGVVCSNCHNPHSAKLTVPKETVCLQCHQPETYATKEHHHHASGSEGAQCVSCHMPETTYMQIDGRRDHKWHIPRPDISHKLGTPDACINCHKDKDSLWSDKVTDGWNPNYKSIDERVFAPVFAAADKGYQDAASALSHIAQNDTHTDIIRASALERLGRYADTNALIAAARGAKHKSEHVRMGAVRGAENLAARERWRILSPLLVDPVLAIRTETVAALMPLWSTLSEQQLEDIRPALNEYLDVQKFNSDRGFSHTNIGNMLVHQGLYAEAEKSYQKSIAIEPIFDAAYIYLSDLYRQKGDETSAKEQLDIGAKINPDNAEFPYRMGLGYIRTSNTAEALTAIRNAIDISPENPQYHYVLALLLEATQPVQATVSIRTAYQLSQNPQHLYGACEMALKYQLSGSEQCLAELRSVVPAAVVENLIQSH